MTLITQFQWRVGIEDGIWWVLETTCVGSFSQKFCCKLEKRNESVVSNRCGRVCACVCVSVCVCYTF